MLSQRAGDPYCVQTRDALFPNRKLGDADARSCDALFPFRSVSSFVSSDLPVTRQ